MKSFLKCFILVLAFMLLSSFQIVKADGGYVVPGEKVQHLVDTLPKENSKTSEKMCLKFVSNLWKTASPKTAWPTQTFCCAYKHSLQYGISGTAKNGKLVTPPPIGAYVYYKDSSGGYTSHNGHRCGHVALYIGNKKVIHAFSGKVRIHDIENIPGYQLTSWGYPMGLSVERIADPAYDLCINLTQYPTGNLTAGNSFGLRGTITSIYKIDKISAKILNGSKVIALTEQSTNSLNINIADSVINKNLKFASLPASDTPYTLVITAHDTSNKTITVSKNFVVTTVIDINLTTIPSTITKGKSFGLRGDITSVNTIIKVCGSIKTTAGTTKFSSIDTPNAKSMDIRYSNLNNKLSFGKLPVGSYVLEIKATDNKGNVQSAKYNFTVK